MQSAFDFFAAGELLAPDLTAEEAAGIAASLGVPGRLEPLGSQQDQNFLIRGDDGPAGVLRIANAAFPAVETAAQDAAAAAVQAAAPELRIATVLERDGRSASGRFPTPAGETTARVIRFLPGGTLVDRGRLAPDVVARMGAVAGRVSAALADFEHDGLDRVLQWDLRESLRVVDLLAGAHPDRERRDAVRRAADAAWATVAGIAAGLPLQAGHFDLTDDNLVAGADGRLPDGVIDFGDVSRGWRVSELAVTLSCLLHHPGGEPFTVLPAVRAFDAVRPLDDAELDALWPLVQLRGAVLVVSGAQQVALDRDNAYASSALDREWRMFAEATAVPAAVMTGLIRDALGRTRPVRLPGGVPLARGLREVDLGVESPHADGGAWLEPGLDDRVAAAAGAPLVARAGVPRIGAARVLDAVSAPTVPTGATLWAGAEDLRLGRPWPGVVRPGEPIELAGDGVVLRVHGARADADALAVVPAGGRAEVQVVVAGAPEVPPMVRPEYAAGWLALTADPGPLLGLEPLPSEPDLLARRERVLAGVQEHYWAVPPRIERGWAVHLVDTTGRARLDMVNNVTAIGHAHPAVTAAAARQLALLNTNSRFHYRAIADLAATLAAALPEPLERVLLVNSGSEAVDLAIRVAQAATGRKDVVAVAEAYHGWTLASDAVSTSVADNPNALGTRPDWVHVVDAPNDYRGRHRDADAHRYGPEAAAAIRALAAAGRPPAAFLAEPFFGNAGGVPLPDGYLEQVYAAVRESGGVAIADEVQVGLGRLGRWFWGFEQQGVVPDVVTLAKSLGNGFPVGAVITTADVAERFASEGSFFSSTGGSPVSSVVASTVLRVIREEGLQERARTVGGRLKRGLLALAERHPLIGAVHGEGLYLGVELVRDRATREPATAETALVCDRLLDLGVIVQPTGDFKNVLKIKPPLVLPEDAADFFVARLDEVLTTGW
ncbi:aminotransferase [Amnibacterium setariae]|uniref:Aminotransferase n=1 Tax=Amnibacterium setariae TaxID=2306585 RepID=A0A3A1U4W7_9MICO|nr:aminotransferase [Amnibacterium setariae]RIX28014.1 aminotransferase [Amnibacterium setariae]